MRINVLVRFEDAEKGIVHVGDLADQRRRFRCPRFVFGDELPHFEPVCDEHNKIIVVVATKHEREKKERSSERNIL